MPHSQFLSASVIILVVFGIELRLSEAGKCFPNQNNCILCSDPDKYKICKPGTYLNSEFVCGLYKCKSGWGIDR